MNQLETALKWALGETALTEEELRRKRMRESNERRFREIERRQKKEQKDGITVSQNATR